MLSALILIPFLGAAIVGLVPLPAKSTRNLAIITAISVLVINLIIASGFDFQHSGLQLVEDIPWIDWLGLHYHLGIDGLSFPLAFIFLYTLK